MGQYYRPILQYVDKEGNTKETEGFNNYVDGKYAPAKLMEHSWFNNPFVCAVASKIWRKRARLAWVGDYADSEDNNWNDEMQRVWEEDGFANKHLIYNGFGLAGKIFVNHTKREYVNLDNFYETSKKESDWVVNPISLLTAIGNGKGNGDYHENDDDVAKVGDWTWDVLEIISCYKINKYEDYRDITEDVRFKEY